MARLLQAFALLLALTSFASAQNSGAIITDPDTLLEYFPSGSTDNLNAGWYNPNTRTQRSAALKSSQRTLVLVGFGQSNICAVNPSAYVPTNGTVLDNFNIGNRGVYAATDPLLGASRSTLGPGNWFSRLGDTLITNNIADRVILVPGGIGATTSAMWAIDQYNRVKVTFQRLKEAGLTASAVLYVQGETDTTLGTSQAAYAANFAAFVSLVRAAGYSGPIFIAEDTWNGTTTSAAIQAAQTGAVTNVPNGIWLLGNMDQNTTTWRQSGAGQPHLNDTGAAAWAAVAYTGLTAYGAPF